MIVSQNTHTHTHTHTHTQRIRTAQSSGMFSAILRIPERLVVGLQKSRTPNAFSIKYSPRKTAIDYSGK
jgi:hypothetical protein